MEDSIKRMEINYTRRCISIAMYITVYALLLRSKLCHQQSLNATKFNPPENFFTAFNDLSTCSPNQVVLLNIGKDY